MKDQDIEERADVASKTLAKLSTAPDKETPDWMLNDIRRGYIAGAKEERERGKRFAEWLFKNGYAHYVQGFWSKNQSTLTYTSDELYVKFLEQENNLTN